MGRTIGISSKKEFVRFAPYLKDGILGYAVAFASCGFTPPDYARQVAAIMGYLTGNPIIVIDKPRILGHLNFRWPFYLGVVGNYLKRKRKVSEPLVTPVAMYTNEGWDGF